MARDLGLDEVVDHFTLSVDESIWRRHAESRVADALDDTRVVLVNGARCSYGCQAAGVRSV